MSCARVIRLPPGGRLSDLLGGVPPGRLFNAEERSRCRARPDLTGWAGRLAAKLAVAGLLELPATGPLDRLAPVLAEISILPADPGGCRLGPGCDRSHPPGVVLTGSLARSTERQHGLQVSISHTRELAVALAVRIQERTAIRS